FGLRPDLVRTLILQVWNLVVVVIEIGTTVFVLKPIRVFWVVRALIIHVEDAIEVVVDLRTAVLVEVTVGVFGFQDAGVLVIEQTVAICVRSIWAAVLVFEAV